MRFKFLMISITKCPHWSKDTNENGENMKMSDNPAKHEVLLKQYLLSILDISVAAVARL